MRKLIALITPENKDDERVIDETYEAITKYGKKMKDAFAKEKKSTEGKTANIKTSYVRR